MELNEEQKHKALIKAEKMAEAFDADEAEAFGKKHTSESWYHHFKTLFEMITDKEYTVDKKSYLIIAGALAYVVFPIDIIPDFIPGVGFVDDAFVLSVVIKQLSDEIAAYKKFKGGN